MTCRVGGVAVRTYRVGVGWGIQGMRWWWTEEEVLKMKVGVVEEEEGFDSRMMDGCTVVYVPRVQGSDV